MWFAAGGDPGRKIVMMVDNETSVDIHLPARPVVVYRVELGALTGLPLPFEAQNEIGVRGMTSEQPSHRLDHGLDNSPLPGGVGWTTLVA
jgi:hypothetical protein